MSFDGYLKVVPYLEKPDQWIARILICSTYVEPDYSVSGTIILHFFFN
jgi:hypothetical protein